LSLERYDKAAKQLYGDDVSYIGLSAWGRQRVIALMALENIANDTLDAEQAELIQAVAAREQLELDLEDSEGARLDLEEENQTLTARVIELERALKEYKR
jgi:hypothetical protein